MAVRLVFLGKLADLAGAPEREVPGPLDWGALAAGLEPDLSAALQGDKVRVALNGEVLSDKRLLMAGEGDEVALLPPVSGG